MIFYWDERVFNLITSQENLLHALQDPYSLDLFGSIVTGHLAFDKIASAFTDHNQIFENKQRQLI